MAASTSQSALVERARQIETARAAQQDGERPTAKHVGSSAALVRLAADLGINVRDLAVRLDPDVVRRTKYPVLEERLPDGRVIYRDPIVTGEGPISK